jgi:hypothetical protein
MNNEPVAYGKYIENAKMWLVVEIGEDIPPNMGYIPLYTHPAKTLTDEEIQEIAHGFEAIGWMGETTYEFARAILRKAQEK